MQQRLSSVVLTILCTVVSWPAIAAEYHDDFANGLDSEYWTVVSNQPQFVLDETGGDVLVTLPDGGSGYQYHKLCFSPYPVGDFDVNVRFSEAQLDAVWGAGGNYVGIEMAFGDQIFVLARNGTADHGHVASVWAEPPGQWIPIPETATSGRLRVARVGSWVSGFFDDTLIHEQDSNTDEVTHLCLVVGTDTSDSVSVRFEEFSLVSDGVNQFRQVAKLIPSDLEEGDSFGDAVALSGDTLAVGASSFAFTGPVTPESWHTSGAAYIFERGSGSDVWVEVAKLEPSAGAKIPDYGAAIALDGDTLAVAAPYACTISSKEGEVCREGIVHVYERDHGDTENWRFVVELEAVGKKELFGRAVALTGDTLFVGAADYGYDYLPWNGAVRVFERDRGGADNWGETALLRPSNDDGGLSNFVQMALAVSQDTVVVGVPSYRFTKTTGETVRMAGAVYIFERNHGGPDIWGEVTRLTADDPTNFRQFGSSVAIDGDVILVGSYAGVDEHWARGSVFVFERDHGGPRSWGQTHVITGDTNPAHVLDLAGDRALISCQYALASAWVKRSSWGRLASLAGREGWHSQSATAEENILPAALDGNTVIIGASENSEHGAYAGAVYVFEVAATPEHRPPPVIRRAGRRLTP